MSLLLLYTRDVASLPLVIDRFLWIWERLQVNAKVDHVIPHVLNGGDSDL